MGLFTRLEKERINTLELERDALQAAHLDSVEGLVGMLEGAGAAHADVVAALEERLRRVVEDAMQWKSEMEEVRADRATSDRTWRAALDDARISADARVTSATDRAQASIRSVELEMEYVKGVRDAYAAEHATLHTLLHSHEFHQAGKCTSHGEVFKLYQCVTCPPEVRTTIMVPVDSTWVP